MSDNPLMVDSGTLVHELSREERRELILSAMPAGSEALDRDLKYCADMCWPISEQVVEIFEGVFFKSTLYTGEN